jgi:hypothetical protein
MRRNRWTLATYLKDGADNGHNVNSGHGRLSSGSGALRHGLELAVGRAKEVDDVLEIGLQAVCIDVARIGNSGLCKYYQVNILILQEIK